MTEQEAKAEANAGDVALVVNALSSVIFDMNVKAGWWTDLKTGYTKVEDPWFIASKMLLIQSEISEAAEAHRKDLMDDKLPHRKGMEVELADAMIRILDLAGAMGFDLGGAMMEKIAYNMGRADHKIENRKQAGGKAY